MFACCLPSFFDSQLFTLFTDVIFTDLAREAKLNVGLLSLVIHCKFIKHFVSKPSVCDHFYCVHIVPSFTHWT